MGVKLGSEVLVTRHSELFSKKRIGLLGHAASVNAAGKHIVEVFKGENVTAIFGPEHGFDGAAQDMEAVKTSGKINSLYGNTFASLSPTPEMLSKIDVLIVDLQDVGSRYYTYANTMALCMRACQAAGINVIVCDRPNPINGVNKEGGPVEPEFRSFVGMYPFSVRHGMTIGEIASFVNENDIPEGRRHLLKVVPMEGWNRENFFDQTGLVWRNPSPNMRSLAAALLYPGMCLLEGTNVSEGRGTRTPFEVCGAPWVDGKILAKSLRGLNLKGIDFDPAVFTPTSRKFEGERCEGVQFIITNRREFKPYLAGLSLIHTIALSCPKQFKWRREPYEFVSDIPAIDLLTGNSKFRKYVDKKWPLEKVLEESYAKKT